ncbi:formimidoylglutamate deiminase [Kordiimonas sediminis]|uniref:Formimidoylglutamate deiminase n=1 Tax=Kordiimonas sediminis TaxID=1735581 RepID=A0A919EAR6_9PROT|nr:formimidoylglutamate deiminase [Kordiimonas sediminis]GHF30872.1 formimidoylglutamate deiminase [Kordiimonas sediminis]
MAIFNFSSLYSGSDWLTNVRLVTDAHGHITSIDCDVSFGASDVVLGPAIPAMQNVHSHAFQRAAVGLTEYKKSASEDFWSWRKAMYGIAAQLTPDRLNAIAKGLYLEMVKAGYSGVGEFHYLHNAHMDQSLDMSMAILKAASEVGIAVTHLPVFYQYAGFGKKAAEEGQQAFVHSAEDFIRFWHILKGRVDGNNRLGVAFHSLRAVDAADIAGMLEKLPASIPCHVHIAEQTAEVEAAVAFTGKRPVELLFDHVPVDEDWTLIHATHLNDAEITAIAESGAVVGVCPTTEANLGDGIFPASQFSRRGGRMAIGSDSHISVDPREELRLLEYSQRLTRRQRTILVGRHSGHVGEYLWRESAINGAQSLGQPCGALEVGKRADLLVLDDTDMAYAGVRYGQIFDALVFAGQPNPIRHVMIGGNWVVENGRHAKEEAIISDYRAAVQEIIRMLESEDA